MLDVCVMFWANIEKMEKRILFLWKPFVLLESSPLAALAAKSAERPLAWLISLLAVKQKLDALDWRAFAWLSICRFADFILLTCLLSKVLSLSLVVFGELFESQSQESRDSGGLL